MAETQVPNSWEEWEADVAAEKLSTSTIHEIKLESASNIKYSQYLMLRVLWQSNHVKKFKSKLFDLEHWVKLAREQLADYESWKRYCSDFANPDNNIPEGTFALAKHYQLQAANTKSDIRTNVIFSPIAQRTRGRQKAIEQSLQQLQLETPTKGRSVRDADIFKVSDSDQSDSEESTIVSLASISPVPKEFHNILYPPTKDEQIVNTALILFLNALTIHFSLSNNWSLHRKAFKVSFKNAAFEARTDGYLEDRGVDKVRALIEVKPASRRKDARRIRMQESAQMVAWIFNDLDFGQSPGRRVHVSQDRHEIYLTFAEYDEKYVKYLKGELQPGESVSFLTMCEYGPWDINERSHMEHLGPILLAITMRADDDRKRQSTQQGKSIPQRKGGLFG